MNTPFENKILVANKSEFLQLATLFASFGYQIGKRNESPQEYTERLYSAGCQLGFHVDEEGDGTPYIGKWRTARASWTIANLADIVAALTAAVKPSSITVTGVGEYQAVVTATGVQVGCQTISHDKVREIVAAIDEVTS